MVSQSIVVHTEETAALLNRLLSGCGRGELHAVLPGQENEKKLLVADCEQMLDYVSGFSTCLAAYDLRDDKRLAGVKVTTFSTTNNAADYTAHGLRVTPEGFTVFEMVSVGCIGRVRLHRLPASGQEPVLAAAAAAVVCGAPLAQVMETLQEAC